MSTHALTIGLSALVGCGSLLLAARVTPPESAFTRSDRQWQVRGQPLVPLTGLPRLGAPGADLTLVEFGDFQCKYCAQFAALHLPSLKTKYIDTGRLQFVFVTTPLPQLRRLSLDASLAAECASRADRFWQFHDMLFAKQADLKADDARVTAVRTAGPAVEGCLASEDALVSVADNAARAFRLDVNSTPRFFLGRSTADGRFRPYLDYSGSDSLAAIELGIDALSRGGGK